jgi:hypothetical protein
MNVFTAPAYDILVDCPLEIGDQRDYQFTVGRKPHVRSIYGVFICTGIFVSVVTGASPLSVDEWRLSNLVTAEALKTIAEHGGPRCCKQDAYLALSTAIQFANQHLRVSLKHGAPLACEFSQFNKECKLASFPFYVRPEEDPS